MKILQLAGYFYPEKAASIYLEENRFQAFADAGFNMLVYAAIPTRGISEGKYKEFKHRKCELMYDNMLEIHRFSMYREGKNPFLRALRYFLISVKQFNLGIAARDIDLIYVASTPPTQGMLAALVKKFKKVPFVYNLQDIFPDSLAGTSLAKKDSFLWKIGCVIENFTYKNADKIIVISEGFKKNIMNKGVPKDKIEVIYNWVDEDAVFDVSREENSLFDQYKLDRKKFYITYCGNIGLTQNMDMLLEVAEEFQPISDIQFVLIGEGVYKERVKELISIKNLQNVRLLPFQPYETISQVFSLGNVGIVISKPGVGVNSVPSKTWSILSASRPVLANFDENELMSILEKNRCGLFTKAGDKGAFKESIMKLYNNRELCSEYGQNGRQFILQNLTRRVGTQKYVDVIKQFDKK